MLGLGLNLWNGTPNVLSTCTYYDEPPRDPKCNIRVMSGVGNALPRLDIGAFFVSPVRKCRIERVNKHLSKKLSATWPHQKRDCGGCASKTSFPLQVFCILFWFWIPGQSGKRCFFKLGQAWWHYKDVVTLLLKLLKLASGNILYNSSAFICIY